MRDTLPSLGADVAMVSIDIDPSENADQVARFADRNAFGWRFAIAPKEMLTDLQRAFGAQFLSPPSEPMFIVDSRGEPHLVPFGYRDAAKIRELVAKYRIA